MVLAQDNNLGEKAKFMDMAAFSPLSQPGPCFSVSPATVGKLLECKVSLFVHSALHLPGSQVGNRAASHTVHE